MKVRAAIQGMAQALLLHLGVSLERKRLQEADPLARGVPRLNMQGDSRAGDKYRIDCTHCRTPFVWSGAGFTCDTCGNTMSAKQAAKAFYTAAVLMLEVSQKLDDVALIIETTPDEEREDNGTR